MWPTLWQMRVAYACSAFLEMAQQRQPNWAETIHRIGLSSRRSNCWNILSGDGIIIITAQILRPLDIPCSERVRPSYSVEAERRNLSWWQQRPISSKCLTYRRERKFWRCSEAVAPVTRMSSIHTATHQRELGCCMIWHLKYCLNSPQRFMLPKHQMKIQQHCMNKLLKLCFSPDTCNNMEILFWSAGILSCKTLFVLLVAVSLPQAHR